MESNQGMKPQVIKGLARNFRADGCYLGTGRFNSVTSVDASVVTPTLDELQAFDAVIASFQSPVYIVFHVLALVGVVFVGEIPTRVIRSLFFRLAIVPFFFCNS